MRRKKERKVTIVEKKKKKETRENAGKTPTSHHLAAWSQSHPKLQKERRGVPKHPDRQTDQRTALLFHAKQSKAKDNMHTPN